jgi:hypothetical protein
VSQTIGYRPGPQGEETAVSIEVTVICDKCGRIIDGGKTAAKTRAAIKRDTPEAKVGLPGGRDVCSWCVHGEPWFGKVLS